MDRRMLLLNKNKISFFDLFISKKENNILIYIGLWEKILAFE